MSGGERATKQDAAIAAHLKELGDEEREGLMARELEGIGHAEH